MHALVIPCLSHCAYKQNWHAHYHVVTSDAALNRSASISVKATMHDEAVGKT